MHAFECSRVVKDTTKANRFGRSHTMCTTTVRPSSVRVIICDLGFVNSKIDTRCWACHICLVHNRKCAHCISHSKRFTERSVDIVLYQLSTIRSCTTEVHSTPRNQLISLFRQIARHRPKATRALTKPSKRNRTSNYTSSLLHSFVCTIVSDRLN